MREGEWDGVSQPSQKNVSKETREINLEKLLEIVQLDKREVGEGRQGVCRTVA